MANLTVGMEYCLNANKGKKVKVLLLSGEVKEFNIFDGVNYDNHFRYIMHTAKNPRKPFLKDSEFSSTMHENIKRGYYYIEPMRIIL
jgi:hypothetical protein